MAIQLALAEKNTILNAYKARFDNATCVLYMGAIPATADTALSGNTVIGTCTFAATAFPVTSTGTLTANAIAQDAAADASGQPTFYRVLNGANVVEQGIAGPSGTDMIVGVQTAGVPILISSFVRSM